MDNGAELLTNFEVTSIAKSDEHYTLSAADGRTVETRFVVNSAGLFSDAVAAMVGDTSFHVHPRSGEYMILDKASGGLCDRTIFRTPTAMGKGILVSPTADGNLLLGPTSTDVTDKTDKATSPKDLRRSCRRPWRTRRVCRCAASSRRLPGFAQSAIRAISSFTFRLTAF